MDIIQLVNAARLETERQPSQDTLINFTYDWQLDTTTCPRARGAGGIASVPNPASALRTSRLYCDALEGRRLAEEVMSEVAGREVIRTRTMEKRKDPPFVVGHEDDLYIENVLASGSGPTPTPGPTSTPTPTSGPTSTPTPTPTSPSSTNFIKGADVSNLLQIEDYGGRFYHEGVQKDLLQILKDHGVNAIRIKVWNDPGNPCSYPANQSDPAGYNNPAHVTQLAVQAKNMGFRIMIDFHYSDWWADPGKQYTPHEWEGQNIDQLRSSLYNFTYNVLSTLKSNGVTPEWVQIGNEISSGMLWPTGSTDNWNNLAALIKEGYSAAKAVDPSIKVVLHYDNGGNNSGTVWWFDNAQSRGVQWDVIGLSYYPIWHGSLSDLDYNIDNVSARYGKDVVIVETAYPWTTQNGDSQPNVYTNTGPVSYPMSPAGQEQFLDDLVSRIKAVPNGRGKGFFYWEPEWIPVEGAGWKVGEGDEWDNVTLFDFSGNALSSLDAFLDW